MAIHEIYRLTCDGCGKDFIDSDGANGGQDPQEVRDLAEDEGWLCGLLVHGDRCQRCRTSIGAK